MEPKLVGAWIFFGRDPLTQATASPAADKWNGAVIGAMRKIGMNVAEMRISAVSYWPRGRLVRRVLWSDALEEMVIPVPNLPVLGILWLTLRMAAVVAFRKVAWVATYNYSGWGFALGLMVRLRGGTWYVVHADGNPCVSWWRRTWLRLPQGHICMSAGARSELRGYRAVTWIGGVKLADPGIEPAEHPRRFLYAGTLTKYGGLQGLLAQWAKIANPDIELHVCGHGVADAKLSALMRNTPQVVVHGFVPEDELHQHMLGAWAFVNPRPLDIAENQFNFPSKLLTYAGYAKPIISTDPGGLPARLRDMVIVASNTEEGLRDALKRVSDLEKREYSVMRASLWRQATGIDWDSECKKLRDWMANT